MNIQRKAGEPQGRYLVAMRPEAQGSDARDMAAVLGLKQELAQTVFGSGWPRVVASRSTLEEAEALARVLTARGREAVAWDSASPLIELFHAERLVLDGEQFLLEQRGRAHRIYTFPNILRVIDLRLRQVGQQTLPERALLLVPAPGGWNQPGVLSTQSIDPGDVPRPQLVAAQMIQEAALRLRSALPDRVLEVRTTAGAMGLEDGEEDELDRMLQLLARLPPGSPGVAGKG